MPTLRTRIHVLVEAILAEDSPGTGATRAALSELATLLNGTGSAQADLVYFAERTLTASTSEVLDLVGSLPDPLGNTLSFAEVVLVAFQNTNSAAGDDIDWGPDATNGWGAGGPVTDASDRRRVNAGGLDLWYDPNGVTATGGSADEVYVTEKGGANDNTYRVLIVGRSA